jgi:hypothetical protein
MSAISIIGLVLWALAIIFSKKLMALDNNIDEKTHPIAGAIIVACAFPFFGIVLVIFGGIGLAMISPIAEHWHWHWFAVIMQAIMSLL